MRFQGQSLVISGGSTGIGLATAQRVAAEGARVAVLARDAARLDAAVAGLPGTGHLALACDVTIEEAVAGALKTVKESWGTVHGGVMCAGAHSVRPLAVAKAANFEEMFRLNVLSAVNVLRPLSRMMPAGAGSLVVVSSVAGLRGAPGASAYATAKGALLTLVRSLAHELAPRGTRINAVVPGVVATAMTEQFLGTLPPSQKESVVKSHPLGLGQPDDVAAAIAFLLSSDARWITGSELVIDGGLSAH